MTPTIRTAAAVLVAATTLSAQGLGGDPSTIWDHLQAAYDQDYDGQVTADEYTRGAAAFANLDRDGDGVLTAKDFERAGAARRGAGVARGSGATGRGAARRAGGGAGRDRGRMIAAMLVGAADGDSSGEVTEKEWQAFVASLQAGDDGLIAGELILEKMPLPAGRARARSDPRMLSTIVAALDKDGDGEVAVGDLEQVFAEMDADGDGALGRGELTTERGGRRAGSRLPRVGEVAPDFELPLADDEEKTVRLSSFSGQKPVALIFGSYT